MNRRESLPRRHAPTHGAVACPCSPPGRLRAHEFGVSRPVRLDDPQTLLRDRRLAGFPDALFCRTIDGVTGSIFQRYVKTAEASETVPLRSFAGWLDDEEVSRIDLLKVDVEGCEVDVLEGLGDRLRDVQVVYLASASPERASCARENAALVTYRAFMRGCPDRC
jgi:hypothetical protein